MNQAIFKACVFVLLTTATSFGQAAAPAKAESARPPKLVLQPCRTSGVEAGAKCGKYEVFENRATKTGRKISLSVMLLPATGPNRQPDPFLYIPGGPGSSATEDASYIAEAFARIRQQRDLLFIDQRGTGGSNPLDCDLFDPEDLQSYLGYFFPLESVRKCRKALEAKADLKLYTTSIAMDDFDEVRAALGYQQWNLFGASYGTRAALVYLKRHPESVRTVTLHGVAPTDQFMPSDFAQQAERALQGVISECVADEPCNKAYPNLRADTRAVFEQLKKGPVEVTVRVPPQNTAQTKIKLSRDLAAEAIRYMLYNSGVAPQIPWFINQAAQGNFTPLAEAALRYRRGIVATGSNGMYLSVTCAEDLPWIKPGAAELLARDTFLGDYRLRQQREACALWPRATLESGYAEPTQSSVPVLILTGQWDPVTPPANGDRVAKSLSNSLHLVVPQGGHGFGGLEGLDCLEKLNTEFVEKGSVEGLDTSCLKQVKRKPFKL